MNSTASIYLRPATSGDFAMALDLYLTAMRPLTSQLMEWDDARQSASFASQWKLDDVRIIVFEGRSVGWMQSSETDSEIFLQQLFISPEYQHRGIGSKVLGDLLINNWEATGKPIVLTVLRNNPARGLYEGFGFSVVGEVGVKLLMRLAPEQSS